MIPYGVSVIYYGVLEVGRGGKTHRFWDEEPPQLDQQRLKNPTIDRLPGGRPTLDPPVRPLDVTRRNKPIYVYHLSMFPATCPGQLQVQIHV